MERIRSQRKLRGRLANQNGDRVFVRRALSVNIGFLRRRGIELRLRPRDVGFGRRSGADAPARTQLGEYCSPSPRPCT